MEVTFNGVNLSNYAKIMNVRRDLLPSSVLTTMKVPNRAGSYFFNRQVTSRVFEVDIMIIGNLRTTADQMAATVNTEQPVPIIFGDDTSKTFYGILTDSTNLDEIREMGKGTLTFFVPDPYAQGTIPQTGNFTAGGFSGNIAGTADAFPTITATFTAPSTFFAVMHGEDAIIVGDPQPATSASQPAKTISIDDGLTTTTGWSVASGLAVDDGTVTGTIASDGSAFYSSNYGTGPGWHGSAMSKSLAAAIQDFELSADVAVQTSNDNQIGRVEIYLLDQNGAQLGRMSMSDPWVGVSSGVVEYRAGTLAAGKMFQKFDGNYGRYKNFSGIVRLRRQGNVWEAYTAKKDGVGHHYNATTARFVDYQNLFGTKLASVAIHIASYSTYAAAATAKVHKITVKQLNVISSTQTAEIFSAGDVLEIDTEKFMVYKNGAQFMKHLDPSSTFFKLKPGNVALAAMPSSAASVSMTYKTRWV